ncbi:MAG TPA: UDP-3-O-acyl-N-acetylglucosamine deacetylase [Candidatus Polarisedimenticolaceae bacterium]|nr:UDP-3-O-acyl-N-acetylglucosamine deacetylase [Candidatus Polarisedimenticolaceae bacterium]
MRYRQTLASPVGTEGVGLHSGRPVRLELRPAEPETGVVFVREDAGSLEIPATLEHAGPGSYATSLERGGLGVGTIEHLMAALYALRIDDVRVILDAAEVPILDGSSRPFVDLLRRAGQRESRVPRLYMTLVRPVLVSAEGKRIAAYPCREYRVTYAIDFDHPALGYQELSASLWGDGVFEEKLAPARTFTFEHEVAGLRGRGLALGGSLDNAIVLGREGMLNADALRFTDEFVRHKMLDLTGDLSLLGRPLRAHVVAYRAGHELHARLARSIWQAQDSWYLAPWSEELPGHETAARA